MQGLLLLSRLHVPAECHNSVQPVLQFQAPLHDRVYLINQVMWQSPEPSPHLLAQ
jgi:hypothetical protein